MVTSNGSIEEIKSIGSIEEVNSISYTYRVTLSVSYHFYLRTLDTSLKRESLWIASFVPTLPFEETHPPLLMHKHLDLLHKGIRNSNLFLHAHKPPSDYKYHVIKVLMSHMEICVPRAERKEKW